MTSSPIVPRLGDRRLALLARKTGITLERAGARPLESRAELVLRLRARGILNHALLEAMEQVPRHMFLEAVYQRDCGEDVSLPIPCGQSTPAPSTIALMIQALDLSPSSRVLEIGTGTGYETAILSRLCQRVVSLERYRTLLDMAEERFSSLRLENIITVHTDGLQGYPRYAPFDAILLSGSVPEIPQPLVEQLADGGRLVAAVGTNGLKSLIRVTKTYRRAETVTIGKARLLPLMQGVAAKL